MALEVERGWSGRHLPNELQLMKPKSSLARSIVSVGPKERRAAPRQRRKQAIAAEFLLPSPIGSIQDALTGIPEEYFSYLGGGGAKAGYLSVEPGWFRLWGCGELKQRNVDYEVQAHAPGFIAFGTTGGSDLFAFDACRRVCLLPLVDMVGAKARLIANSWTEFAAVIEASK